MKATLESTDKLVTIQIGGTDVPARIWQGVTEAGVEFHIYVTRVAVQDGLDSTKYAQFEMELKETSNMRPEIAAIPLRLIL